MGARIRLRRVGRKKQASYRVVVAEQSAARDGSYIEAIGFYNPRRQPAELRLDMERVDYWMSHGAQPTETAAELIRKAKKGGDPKVKLYTGDEQPATETSPVAVRARRSERTKPTVKSATPTPAEVENAIASDADGHKPVEGDPVAEAHAQPHPDAAREAAAEAKASEE